MKSTATNYLEGLKDYIGQEKSLSGKPIPKRLPTEEPAPPEEERDTKEDDPLDLFDDMNNRED